METGDSIPSDKWGGDGLVRGPGNPVSTDEKYGETLTAAAEGATRKEG